MSEILNDTTEIKVPQSSLEHEMRTSFLDYAMSVIVDRALPDVRDRKSTRLNSSHIH